MIWRRTSHEIWVKVALMIVLCIGVVTACGRYKSPLASEVQKAAPSPSPPESVPQSGHSKPVTSVAFSPDGKTLASGSEDQAVKLWDVSTGAVLRTLKHSSPVNSVAFSPDGKTLASGSGNESGTYVPSPPPLPSKNGSSTSFDTSDNTVRLWEVATGVELRIMKGHSGAVLSVAFSPDGKILASGSDDNSIKLWNVSTGAELRSLKGHSDFVRSVAFSPDGKILASGSDDNSIKLWNVSTGDMLNRHDYYLRKHSDRVESVTFSPDGKTLASGSVDGWISLSDTSKGEWLGFLFRPQAEDEPGIPPVRRHPEILLRKEPRWFSGSVLSVAFSPDGKILAGSTNDGSVKLWDASNRELLRTIKAHSEKVNSIAFSPDGKLLASGSNDHTVKLWDVSTGTELRTFKGQ